MYLGTEYRRGSCTLYKVSYITFCAAWSSLSTIYEGLFLPISAQAPANPSWAQVSINFRDWLCQSDIGSREIFFYLLHPVT